MNYAISTMQQAMNQDQLHLRSITHNIANMETPAYKRQLSNTQPFEQLLQTATPIHHVFTQGTLKETGNPAHLAIKDDSFFQVKTEAGFLYTRRGDFTVNDQGKLVTSSGALLMGKQGDIQVDSADFVINTAGEIFLHDQKIDQIQLVQFSKLQSLQYVGDGLFKTEEKPALATGIQPLLQGSLETANVKSLEEMAHLTQIARHFETTQRVLKIADNLRASAISQLGATHV